MANTNRNEGGVMEEPLATARLKEGPGLPIAIQAALSRIVQHAYTGSGSIGFTVASVRAAVTEAYCIGTCCAPTETVNAEMLSALKQVMGWISAWDPNFTQDDEWPECAHHVRAIIAKAEGQTSEASGSP